MKSTKQAHFTHPWRVHTLAADFALLDVWRFEVRLEAGRGFDAFLDTYWEAIHAVERSPLSRMRVAIGRVMGWDDAPNSLAIPGCTEHLVTERLDAADRARNRFAADEPSPLPVAKLRPVYRFDDEVLYEVSNDTVHALMHVSCAPGAAPELAVYIKSRGLFTQLYMAAIWPARRAIIYPSLMSLVERGWRAQRTQARHVT
ncbi:MAG: DUF2867 domain-containing protein [Deltaproteobacteria bacterium]|nr:DUF2867 domain-containing protein [Deltaproteobacteria bacterium]